MNAMIGGTRSESRRRFSLGLEKYSALYLWAICIVVFGVWTPSLFLTSSTPHIIATQQAVPAIVAIAVIVPMATGAFDLSVGASTNMLAILVVVLQNNFSLGMWPAIVVTLAAGAVVGAINGFLVVVIGIDSFIVTLGTSVILAAVQQIISSNQQPLPITSSSWLDLTQKSVGGFQVVILYTLVVAIIIWWLLDHTPAGRYMYAVGGNKDAARLSGVAVGKWQWIGLTISGFLCGIAGVLYGSLNGPSLTFGPGMLLPAFAAVFLGSTQVRPGRVNIWGTMIATFLLATAVEGLQLVTGVQWLNQMFSGLALIIAVGFAVMRPRIADRRILYRLRGMRTARNSVGEDAVSGGASAQEPAATVGGGALPAGQAGPTRREE
jgi:ribose transport system permease protein